MRRYRLTPEAENDILQIWSYIAEANVQAADRVEAAIHKACILLATSPFHGHPRSDLTALPLRFWTLPRYRSYTIVYDPETKPLQIVRILNGARNTAVILRGGLPS